MQSPPGPPEPPFAPGLTAPSPPPPPLQYGVSGPHQAPAYAAAPTNGLGTAAGVLGIVGAVLMLIPFINVIAIVLGALALIFGFIGLKRAPRLGGAGRGMAVTGIVLGVISVALPILFIAAIYGTVNHVAVP